MLTKYCICDKTFLRSVYNKSVCLDNLWGDLIDA